MSIENARSELKIFVDSCFGSLLGKVRFLRVGLCGCESPFPERNQGLFYISDFNLKTLSDNQRGGPWKTHVEKGADWIGKEV